MKQTLQSRIVLGMSVIIVFSTLTAAALSAHLLIRSHEEAIREQLQTAATSLVTLEISKISELSDFDQLDNFISDTLQMERVNKVVRVFDASKKLIFTSAGLDYDQLPTVLHGNIEKPVFMTLEGKKRGYESLVVPYVVGKKKNTFFLQIAIPLPEYSEILKLLWWQSVLLLSSLIVVSLVLSHFLAKRLLKPVEAIARHLAHMDPSKIEQWEPLRLSRQGQYLEAIAEGINLLAQRTQRAVSHLRKMTRYLAHELRTPLTILRGEAETTLADAQATRDSYANVLQSSLDELEQMSDIVTTVLKVGEEEGRISLQQSSPLDLTAWLKEYKPRWERTLGRSLQMLLPENIAVSVFVDPDLLYRLLDNLVRNIRDHTPPNSQCTLELQVIGQRATLRVMDNGPGLRPIVVESLNRKGENATSIRIGLDLCFRIAGICGLELQFSNRPEGGFCAEIIF